MYNKCFTTPLDRISTPTGCLCRRKKIAYPLETRKSNHYTNPPKNSIHSRTISASSLTSNPGSLTTLLVYIHPTTAVHTSGYGSGILRVSPQNTCPLSSILPSNGRRKTAYSTWIGRLGDVYSTSSSSRFGSIGLSGGGVPSDSSDESLYL